MAEGEAAPTCDGVIIHPGTPMEERLTYADAHLRGVRVEDPNVQSLIDAAARTDRAPGAGRTEA